MTDRIELEVPVDAAGDRLDAWLADALHGSSRAHVQRLLRAGQVLVEGQRQPKGFRLAGGELVSVQLDLPKESAQRVDVELVLAFEDEYLVIVDKPAGLVVHPAAGHRAITLVDLLAEHARGVWRPLVVHRLDKNTSGLMVVAKDERIRESLRELIRSRRLEREYIALLRGRIEARSGTIDAPIGRDVRKRTRMSTRTSKPRAARTHFSVERFLGDFTLVRARLETGRTHQIRAHFAANGTPVCGDSEYGGGGLLGLERQFLHSTRIAFAHPQTSVQVECRSELPADLTRALGLADREPPRGRK